MFILSQAGQKASSGQGYFPDWVEEYVPSHIASKCYVTQSPRNSRALLADFYIDLLAIQNSIVYTHPKVQDTYHYSL